MSGDIDVPAGVNIGFTPVYPLYSFAKVFNALNSEGENNPARPYNEALIKVYLFKGTHHFITCINPDDIQLPQDVLCNEEVIKICNNWSTMENLECTDSGGPGAQ